MSLNQRSCKICGCTDYCACNPPCSWIEEDLCSACGIPEETIETEALKKVNLKFNDLAVKDKSSSDLEKEFTLILNALRIPSIKDVCDALAEEFDCEVKYDRMNGFYRTDRQSANEFLCPTKDIEASFAPYLGDSISYELATVLIRFYGSEGISDV